MVISLYLWYLNISFIVLVCMEPWTNLHMHYITIALFPGSGKEPGNKANTNVNHISL